MAKHALVRRSAPRVVVVSAPRRSGRGRRALRRVGRAAGSVGRHAKRALPTTSVVIGGLAVGYLDGKGYLSMLPAIQGSRTITLALAGYAATRFFRHPIVRAAGIAALGSAAVEFGRGQAKASGWGAEGDGGWGLSGDYYGDVAGADQY